jgi:hypothetical protein
MADVIINIRGNASGLQNDLNQIGNQGSSTTPMGGNQTSPSPQNNSGGTPAMPTYDRMSQDIRREIQSRGVMMVPGSSNFNQFMNTVQQQQRESGYQAIDTKYDVLFDQLQQQRRAEENNIRQEIEQERRIALNGSTDPLRINSINSSYDTALNRRLAEIENKYSPLYEQLETESAQEREQLDKELAEVMRDLVDELRNGNQNSYLGKLRTQYNEAIERRDNAETEEEARAAAREAADIQQRMSGLMGGGNQNPLQKFGAGWGVFTSVAKIGMDAYSNYLANTGRQIDVLSSAANGDVFGAMEQDLMRRRQNYAAVGGAVGGGIGAIIGGAAGALGSFGIGTGAGIAGGAVLGSGAGSWLGSSVFQLMHGNEENQVKLGSLWAQQEKRLQEFTQLAMLTKGTAMWSGEHVNNIDAVRYTLMKNLKNSFGYFEGDGGINIYDLGYNASQASAMISQRLLQKGFISQGIKEITNAINADALEKAFNLSNGSLSQLSAYDRYGNNTNQDFVNLMVSLDAMNTLGMSNGQKLRSNEFLGYQQQLLEFQKSWMLNPNSQFASRQLLAAQNIYGNSLDSRGIQTIGRLNDAITNPEEGMTKVLTYDVIQKLFPSTRGSVLGIQEKIYSQDPEDRAKIQEAIIEKIISVYGNVDSESGYQALSHYTKIRNPHELKKVIDGIRKGIPQLHEGSVGKEISSMKNYTQETQKQMLQFTDDTMVLISKELSGLRGVADVMLRTFKESLDEIVKELK